MLLSEELLKKLRAQDTAWSKEALGRLNSLADFCPVYRSVLIQHPEYFPWLENPANRDEQFRFGAFQNIWQAEFDRSFKSPRERLSALQRFRRKMSLRIAYRDINELSDITDSLTELSLLAEFCLQSVTRLARTRWEENLGQPWNEEADRPARFCILGLGKLGGGELNFCSDIDLIYFFEIRGFTRINGRPTQYSNTEFYSRLSREITSILQERSEDGFLYNVDLRLRPEGNSGPIVRSLAGLENYYSAAGQTWERLALIRARPVAGDVELGGELLESINSFRYPLHPPLSLLSEVAGVKIRTEKEIVGLEALSRDIKSGHGGIREIEFFVQALQLINAGRNPFLQTHSTLAAIDQLERYQFIIGVDAKFLRETYCYLRRIEHRLQMREERRTHLLPKPGPAYDALARSLGHAGGERFEADLAPRRDRVRTLYQSLFEDTGSEEKIQEWTIFLRGEKAGEPIVSRLEQWFQRPAEEVAQRLRQFVLGGAHNLLTREIVLLFMEISDQFDEVLPPLAHPMRTLERINVFAECYGARKQFFKTCSQNPNFFKALCLLFDRSSFIHDLICKHPEILEEIFYAGLRPVKDLDFMRDEIAHGPRESDRQFSRWLWLYVKAEQVRLAIADMLEAIDSATLESQLSLLADVVLESVLRRVDPEGELAIVAFGKYGGGELAFGSDLDLMIISDKSDDLAPLIQKTMRLQRIAGHRQPLGHTFVIDLRLRPHGKDGPAVTTLPAFRKYHSDSAKTWERQILTRARVVTGNELLGRKFVEIRNKLIYSRPADDLEIREIWKMRLLIEKEKGKVNPPQRAFKAGAGGLIDIEFLTQIMQLKEGATCERLREPHTGILLQTLIDLNLIGGETGRLLLDNYGFLRKIERYLRREKNDALATIGAGREPIRSLAKWMNFAGPDIFWDEHCARMKETRRETEKFLRRNFNFS